MVRSQNFGRMLILVSRLWNLWLHGSRTYRREQFSSNSGLITALLKSFGSTSLFSPRRLWRVFSKTMLGNISLLSIPWPSISKSTTNTQPKNRSLRSPSHRRTVRIFTVCIWRVADGVRRRICWPIVILRFCSPSSLWWLSFPNLIERSQKLDSMIAHATECWQELVSFRRPVTRPTSSWIWRFHLTGPRILGSEQVWHFSWLCSTEEGILSIWIIV